jgi:hypothetical protein
VHLFLCSLLEATQQVVRFNCGFYIDLQFNEETAKFFSATAGAHHRNQMSFIHPPTASCTAASSGDGEAKQDK